MGRDDAYYKKVSFSLRFQKCHTNKCGFHFLYQLGELLSGSISTIIFYLTYNLKMLVFLYSSPLKKTIFIYFLQIRIPLTYILFKKQEPIQFNQQKLIFTLNVDIQGL